MTAPINVLSSRRTVLLAVLAKHEQFLAEFDPERDAIEINIRIAKVQKLSVDLEAIQARLEDAAATEEVISHNAALRDDFSSRLIRLEAHLKAKRVHAPRSASTTPNTNPLADSASQPDLMSSRFANRLGIKSGTVDITLIGAGQSSIPVRKSMRTTVSSRASPYAINVEFLIVEMLIADLPAHDVPTSGWKLPPHIIFADPHFEKSAPIDIILGARHYHTFFVSGAQYKMSSNLPVLMESVFGWVVSGSASTSQPATSNTFHTSSVVCMVSLEESIERFWKVEELQVNDGYSPEDRKYFDDKLGLSKAAARRFSLLERRLERDPNVKAAYHDFMREYLELGHMSRIKNPSDDERAYYLPHHPVFKAASSTTKVRVVFDGSAKTSTGFSLNEALCVGPVVQDDLLDIILRFSTYKVAVVGDIAKITLLQLANDEGASCPNAAAALKTNFYVDDFIGGADSIGNARQLQIELSQLLAKGGFELRKWTSNQLEVLAGLNADQIGTQSARQFLPHETVKALGVSWEPEHDVLSFESATASDVSIPTKRSILSNVARMFDPLSLISPIVIRAKMMMQRLWLQKAGWDEYVPDTICKKWKTIQEDWQLISEFKVSRYALLPGARIQLHTFCDASEAAYGACIYARCEGEGGQIRITLLSSKSRVAPLKRVTLPRLELCAAVLGVHLHHRVKKAMEINVAESFFWSDSTITLTWISATPNTWATFVANRVSEVQHYSHPRQWRHVPGASNPADLVSQGMSAADFLKSKLWSFGPDWLSLPASIWPNSNPEPANETNLEIRQLQAIAAYRIILHSLHT
uniref:uncharacterized protein LOC120959822 n=1 Tax=Anopheles coluzzii TaxID=1518534 RepID=UPI0020FF9408|nr:uncharacterized protein LOC120959822 [Anopheles coluzzii]